MTWQSLPPQAFKHISEGSPFFALFHRNIKVFFGLVVAVIDVLKLQVGPLIRSPLPIQLHLPRVALRARCHGELCLLGALWRPSLLLLSLDWLASLKEVILHWSTSSSSFFLLFPFLRCRQVGCSFPPVLISSLKSSKSWGPLRSLLLVMLEKFSS